MSTRRHDGEADRQAHAPAPLAPGIGQPAASGQLDRQQLGDIRRWLEDLTARRAMPFITRPPDEDRQLQNWLLTERSHLAKRLFGMQSEQSRLQEQATHIGDRRRALERDIAQARQRLVARKRDREAERRMALAAAERDSDRCESTRKQITTLASTIRAAEAHSARGKPRKVRADAIAARGKPEYAESVHAKARRRAQLIIGEGLRPIAYLAAPEICGVRSLPACLFAEPLPMPATYSRIVGGAGALADLPWDNPQGLTLAIALLESHRPAAPIQGGQIRHVGHGVLSKPNDPTATVQAWTDASAVRAARCYLVGQGADPDRHTWLAFVHSQAIAKAAGAHKVEEAVHVLWSRVRDDGLIHQNTMAFVSAAVARARYDVAAGIDPGRISMTLSGRQPVRMGLAAVAAGDLHAQYLDPLTRQPVVTVPLQNDAHLAAVGAEGHPESGDFAGTWTPKPAYRSHVGIHDILVHLSKGD
jgi:hypothetical protein